MSKANQPTRQTQPDHSAAKVRVFTYYLGIYLSILGKNKSVDSVYLYDLMCGEGEYADGREGSALKGLREVLRYLNTYPAETLHIHYLLNDAGMSDLEPGRSKIDRVKEKAAIIPFEPAHKQRLTVAYRTLPLSDVMRQAIDRVQQLTAFRQKALLFIDPWGYKDIRTDDLKAALAGGQSEVLLFLPIEMMWRFIDAVYHEPFKGGEALQDWLKDLFPEALPTFTDIHDFIQQFRQRLQRRIDVKYSSRFTLQAPNRNTYSLFYFTSSRKGLLKMLESQWKEDPDEGSGHRADQNFNLFKPGEIANYPARVQAYLAAAPSRTNEAYRYRTQGPTS
jgi:three-Cys-motif partner protein